MDIFGEVVGLYLSTNGLFALKDLLRPEGGRVHWLKMCLGAQNICYFTLCMAKHVGWMNRGNELAKAYVKLRTALFRLKRSRIDALTETQKSEIDELISRTDCNSPLRWVICL